MRLLYAAILPLAFFICLSVSLPAYAQDDTSHGGFDDHFSGYIVETPPYDIDKDERFMYFNKNFGFSVGTGIRVNKGVTETLIGSKSSPIIDFRLLAFVDLRYAIGLGVSQSVFVNDFGEVGKKFDGEEGRDIGEVVGVLETKLTRLDVFLKRYYSPRMRINKVLGMQSVDSPVFHFTFGVWYEWISLDFKKLNETYAGVVNRDLLGVNLPIPYTAVGVDINLFARRASLTLGARFDLEGLAVGLLGTQALIVDSVSDRSIFDLVGQFHVGTLFVF